MWSVTQQAWSISKHVRFNYFSIIRVKILMRFFLFHSDSWNLLGLFFQVCGPPGMMKHISGNKAKDYSQGEVQEGISIILSSADQLLRCLLPLTCSLNFYIAAHRHTQRAWIHGRHGLQILKSRGHLESGVLNSNFV